MSLVLESIPKKPWAAPTVVLLPLYSVSNHTGSGVDGDAASANS